MHTTTPIERTPSTISNAHLRLFAELRQKVHAEDFFFAQLDQNLPVDGFFLLDPAASNIS
jgi:hypothetical protein